MAGRSSIGDSEPEKRADGQGVAGSTVAVLRGRVLTVAVGRDPDDVVDAETEAMYWEGVPANTQAVYRYQLARFVSWCGQTGREHLPATVATIRAWINAHWEMKDPETGRKRGRRGQPYAPDTVRLSLAVIAVLHQAHGLDNPVHHRDAIVQMRGYARKWKRAGFRPDEAHALTPGELIAMVRTCDLTTSAGLRDAALLRLTYDIGRRNSEMLALDWPDLRWLDADRLEVRMPFGKTDKDVDEAGDVVAVEADVDLAPDLCPLKLLRALWNLSVARGRGDGAVFKEVNSGGRRKDGSHSGVITSARMTRRAFQDVVSRAARLAEVDRDPETGTPRKVVPHSLRAGFATASEEAGVPLQATADRGGWSRESPTIMRYYRTGKKWGARNPAVMIRRAAKATPPPESGTPQAPAAPPDQAPTNG